MSCGQTGRNRLGEAYVFIYKADVGLLGSSRVRSGFVSHEAAAPQRCGRAEVMQEVPSSLGFGTSASSFHLPESRSDVIRLDEVDVPLCQRTENLTVWNCINTSLTNDRRKVDIAIMHLPCYFVILED